MGLMISSGKGSRLVGDNALAGKNHKTAALWNRSLVLRLVRQQKKLSRRQISQITGLRGSTLTYIVRELLEKKVLRTVGKVDKKAVGQKQVLLDINPELGYFLGFSLRPRQAKVVLCDAAGRRMAGSIFPIDGPLETIPAQLRAGTTRWFEEMGIPAGRLLGVGVGVTGVVSTVDGMVLRSILFDARQVPLRALLAEQFPGTTIQIDHDACFGALAEASNGVAQNISHFIYFSINHNRQAGEIRLNSFGSALFLDGHVYRGAHYAAGELDTGLMPRRDLVADESDMACLASANAPLSNTLKELAQSVGATLASMVNFLDAEMVVIGGNSNVTNVRFLAAVNRQMEPQLVQVPGRVIRLVVSQVRDEAVALGAAIAACETAIESGSLIGDGLPLIARV